MRKKENNNTTNTNNLRFRAKAIKGEKEEKGTITRPERNKRKSARGARNKIQRNNNVSCSTPKTHTRSRERKSLLDAETERMLQKGTVSAFEALRPKAQT